MGLFGSSTIATLTADVDVTDGLSAMAEVKIKRWIYGRLQKTGAYTRGAMKYQIKPRKAGTKKSRTVTITPIPGDYPPHWTHVNYNPINCLVQKNGPVLNLKTNRPVPRAIAERARQAVAARRVGQGVGQPPRRGASDKLRRGIIFITDMTNQSVAIGPWPFPAQPSMNRKTVPSLLNQGGIEIIAGKKAHYGPRPYVETVLNIGYYALRHEILTTQLHN